MIAKNAASSDGAIGEGAGMRGAPNRKPGPRGAGWYMRTL